MQRTVEAGGRDQPLELGPPTSDEDPVECGGLEAPDQLEQVLAGAGRLGEWPEQVDPAEPTEPDRVPGQ